MASHSWISLLWTLVLVGAATCSFCSPSHAQERTNETTSLPASAHPLTREEHGLGLPVAPSCGLDWSLIPRPHPFPRVGHFLMPPKGCGYSSGLDWLRGEARETAPKAPYPAFALMHPSLFDADFRYLDAPGHQPLPYERLHRIHIGDNWLFGTGGQASWRHMHEFSSRFTGRTNDFDLLRARVFTDLWFRDSFRIYAEFISAHTRNEDLAPSRSDRNRADFLNLFFDVKVGEFRDHPAYVRVGRQELNIGSTRLISTLDWANTRRTFEGVRGFWLGEKVDFDVFWVQPVLFDNTRFDYADHNQNFGGAFLTYHSQKGRAVDLYYLFLDNHNNTAPLGLVTAPTVTHTLGSRYSGDHNGFLWDAEGAFQLGQRGDANLRAGMATAGLGYNWSQRPLNPTVWAYYDWASGDGSPNSGDYNTFNAQFPFGHYYFGFLDLVGRQNIRDWNLHLYLHPAKWVTFNAQYHFFSLDRASDALYTAGNAPIRFSTSGAAGGGVGQELDLLLNFHLGPQADLLVGYSKLNAGEFISNTGNGRSPELFYLMYNVRW